MWNKAIDYILRNREKFEDKNDKDSVLAKVLKEDPKASKDVFNPNALSKCCGFYTYIWDRSYDFVGFVSCSKCRKNCSILKEELLKETK